MSDSYIKVSDRVVLSGRWADAVMAVLAVFVVFGVYFAYVEIDKRWFS